MWWEGGRWYWGSSEGGRGIVVVFAWPSSQERHLDPYIQLYSSFGWRTLVCHADFLTLYFPEKGASFADRILRELVQELKVKSLPVIFVAFSAGSKSCMYKILQLIDGKSGGQLTLGDYQLVKGSICGQIYDSSPVDFTSDLGTQFMIHPSVKTSQPPRILSWMAKSVASGLDTLFMSRFEAQRSEYWRILYSSVNMGPFLLFCSEDDELAPFPVICSFSQRLQELGGDVKLIKWTSSPHVGHFEHRANEYRTAVTELFGKAYMVHMQRMKQLHGARMEMDSPSSISESVCNLHKAAISSNESFRKVAVDPSDHFFLPSSMEYRESSNASSAQSEKNELFHLQNVPAINAHGVLSHLLFDVCVPKNIEGWDIKSSMSLNGRQSFTSSCRHGSVNPLKFLRRSKL